MQVLQNYRKSPHSFSTHPIIFIWIFPDFSTQSLFSHLNMYFKSNSLEMETWNSQITLSYLDIPKAQYTHKNIYMFLNFNY